MTNIAGSKKDCGHFCASISSKLCCRCHNPANDEYFLPWSLMCPICKGVLRKYPDGFYTQRCPECGNIKLTLDRHGTPMCAPMVNCGCKQEWAQAINNLEKSIEHIEKARKKLEVRLERNIKALERTHDIKQVDKLIEKNKQAINRCKEIISLLKTQQDFLFDMIRSFGIFKSENPERVYKLMGKYYEKKRADIFLEGN